MRDPLADALLGGLAAGGCSEAHLRQNRFVSEAIEGDAEGRAAPCAERWLDFDKCAIHRAGESSKDKVNALQGELALSVGKAVAGDLFGE
jgi:hypothetical protein